MVCTHEKKNHSIRFWGKKQNDSEIKVKLRGREIKEKDVHDKSKLTILEKDACDKFELIQILENWSSVTKEPCNWWLNRKNKAWVCVLIEFEWLGWVENKPARRRLGAARIEKVLLEGEDTTVREKVCCHPHHWGF